MPEAVSYGWIKPDSFDSFSAQQDKDQLNVYWETAQMSLYVRKHLLEIDIRNQFDRCYCNESL